MMATPGKESKVGNSILNFTEFIGGERVNFLVYTGTLHFFSLSKVV